MSSAVHAADLPAARGLSHAEETITEASGRWALIVGIDAYDDPRILDLEYSDDDASALAQTLIASGAFVPEHVVVMTPGTADLALRPTRNNLLRELEDLKRVQDADMVVFFYSGHGLGAGAENARENYLIPMDASLDVIQDSALSVDRVLETLDQLPARQRLVVFDACRSQVRADVRGGLPEAWAAPRYALSEGTEVVYCTRFGDVSYEDPDQGHGACTGLILDALSGRADGAAGDPPDEVVSVRELQAWLESRLPALSFGGAPQEPSFAGESTGDFALTAARLPPPPPGVPVPGEALTDQALRAGLQIALSAHGSGERVGFLSAAHDLEGALPGLQEPITPGTAADFHRLEFLYQATIQDRDRALGSLRSVATLAPAAPPLAGLSPVPPGYDSFALSDRASDSGPHVHLPRKVDLYVDGRQATHLPEERPAIVQAVNCDRSVQWTRLLAPGQTIPAGTGSGVTCGDPGPRAMAIGAGASTLLTGAFVGVAAMEARAFDRTLKGQQTPLDADVEAAAQRHQSLANGFGFAAQAGGALSVGLGVGWVVLKVR